MDSFLLKGNTFRGRKDNVGKFALSEWKLTERRKRAVRRKHPQKRTRLNTAPEHQRRVSVYVWL